MKTSVKIALCVILMLFAAASLLAVLSDLGALPKAETAQAETGYELRNWEGFIALFSPPGGRAPVGLTEIKVADLPTMDRLALAEGIRRDTYDEIVRLLEDFGA